MKRSKAELAFFLLIGMILGGVLDSLIENIILGFWIGVTGMAFLLIGYAVYILGCTINKHKLYRNSTLPAPTKKENELK